MKIIVLLALVFATLASPAYSADEGLWKNWGAAPYASSLEEAYKKAPEAINGFDIPLAVKKHFTENPSFRNDGKEVWLTPNMTLEEMWSGKDSKHPTAYVMQKRTVAELSVLNSPDKRPYRKGSVAETARAFSWECVYEGQTYILYLPYVCFNWCWAFGPPPVPVPEKCVEISFNAPPGGKVRWGVASSVGPLPPSECNAQRQGYKGPWTAWIGQCDACIRTLGAITFIREFLGSQADILHKFIYPVTSEYQTLRFSTVIWTDIVYICLEDSKGNRTMGVYIRPQDWKKEQYEFFVQDHFWRSDKEYKE